MLGAYIDRARSDGEFEVDLETTFVRTRSYEYRKMKCEGLVMDVVAIEAEVESGASDNEGSESESDDEEDNDDDDDEDDDEDDEALLPANQRKAAQKLEAAQARAEDKACIAELTARFITTPARQVFKRLPAKFCVKSHVVFRQIFLIFTYACPSLFHQALILSLFASSLHLILLQCVRFLDFAERWCCCVDGDFSSLPATSRSTRSSPPPSRTPAQAPT